MARAVGRVAIGLLLVCIACVIILVIWLQVATPDDEYDGVMHVEVTKTGINDRALGDEDYWDITYTVTDDTYQDYALYSEVDIVITCTDGSILFNNLSFQPNDPMRYDNASDGKVEVQAWYIEEGWLIDGTTLRKMNKGDSIVFTGLTRRFQDASVSLYQGYPDSGSPSIVEFHFPKSFG